MLLIAYSFKLTMNLNQAEICNSAAPDSSFEIATFNLAEFSNETAYARRPANNQ